MSLKYEPSSEPLHISGLSVRRRVSPEAGLSFPRRVWACACCSSRGGPVSAAALTCPPRATATLPPFLSTLEDSGRFSSSGKHHQGWLGPRLVRCSWAEKESSLDNLLVRVYFIIVMIRWTGLAPWEFGFPSSGRLRSTFLVVGQVLFSLGRCSPPWVGVVAVDGQSDFDHQRTRGRSGAFQ